MAKSEHQQRMDEIKERGLVRIDPADGLPILNAGSFYGPQYHYEYEIDEPIRHRADLVDWLFHLREKIWFTAQMQDDFLYVAERINKKY